MVNLGFGSEASLNKTISVNELENGFLRIRALGQQAQAADGRGLAPSEATILRPVVRPA